MCHPSLEISQASNTVGPAYTSCERRRGSATHFRDTTPLQHSAAFAAQRGCRYSNSDAHAPVAPENHGLGLFRMVRVVELPDGGRSRSRYPEPAKRFREDRDRELAIGI